MSGLSEAIKATGSQQKLAVLMGVSPMAVSKWVKNDSVPIERVLIIEKLTGVPRYELRPDIYPPEEYKHAS